MDELRHYRQVWAVDFEFHAAPGERPAPLCVVARELRTGELVRWWLAGSAPGSPPYSTDPDSLFVAFYASAELGCHLALCWSMPARILDLYAEYRNRNSGLPVPRGYGMLGAMAYFGLDAIKAVEKEAMRSLALRGGPYTDAEKTALLDYCQSDVDALALLLLAMLPEIDLPRALLRGRYMAAAAQIEWQGIPLDVDLLQRLRTNWEPIKHRIIAAVDSSYGVFIPADRSPINPQTTLGTALLDAAGAPVGCSPLTFSTARFAEYLARAGISWPRLETGSLALDEDTFKEMARAYPEAIGPLRDVLRIHRGELKRLELTVGSDGRNRYLLSAFSSKTGRNQPSNSKSIFGPSAWLRFLIRPGSGLAIAYVDWNAQEYGIAAALSGDPGMLRDYSCGDPYLAFAKRAGAVPADATKRTHGAIRDLFKVCCGLGAMYGAGERSLAMRLGISPVRARELLRLHRQTYPVFWRWSDSVQDFAMLHGYLETVFGWRVHVGPDANPRSLRNFPMQANGAEMLRLACCLATERGINVCAPVHDALLVEGPAADIEVIVARTQEAMKEASAIVLGGFELRTDAKIVCYSDRYTDDRGHAFFERVVGLLDTIVDTRPITAVEAF